MTERVDHVVASKSCVAVFSLKPVMLPDVVLIFVFFIGSSLLKIHGINVANTVNVRQKFQSMPFPV